MFCYFVTFDFVIIIVIYFGNVCMQIFSSIPILTMTGNIPARSSVLELSQ